MNYIQKSLSEELRDPFISLKTLADWTGQSVSTLRNEWKRDRLKVHRISPRCLRVRMSDAKKYVARVEGKAA